MCMIIVLSICLISCASDLQQLVSEDVGGARSGEGAGGACTLLSGGCLFHLRGGALLRGAYIHCWCVGEIYTWCVLQRRGRMVYSVEWCAELLVR